MQINPVKTYAPAPVSQKPFLPDDNLASKLRSDQANFIKTWGRDGAVKTGAFVYQDAATKQAIGILYFGGDNPMTAIYVYTPAKDGAAAGFTKIFPTESPLDYVDDPKGAAKLLGSLDKKVDKKLLDFAAAKLSALKDKDLKDQFEVLGS